MSWIETFSTHMHRAHARNSIDTSIIILELIALVHTSGGIFVVFNTCFLNFLQNAIMELLLVGIQPTNQGGKKPIASACNVKARCSIGVSCVSYCYEPFARAVTCQINCVSCCSCDKCWFTDARTGHNIYQIINLLRGFLVLRILGDSISGLP